MTAELKYAIIGAGGIGAFYGGKLAKAGKKVDFLLHSDYQHVKENGLTVESILGDFRLPAVPAFKSTSDMTPCDVVLVCLKTTNNGILKPLLTPLLHKDTLVLLIQNGLGMEENLQKSLPALKIAGAMAFICSTKTAPGHIKHIAEGSINIGNYSSPDESVIRQVADDLLASGIKASIVSLNIARWKKLVWNIPYNGLSVILGATTKEMMENQSTRTLIKDLMTEVIIAANKSVNGAEIPLKYADDMLELTDTMPPYAPSMKEDYDASRPLEIEYIYSNPVKEAQKHGAPMHKVSAMEKQLLFLNERRQKK
jgi:2-dehydropantoate 2-reductase